MGLIREAAYAALDLATLGRGVKCEISGEMIRIPARWSRYYETNYEPETFEFFRNNVSKRDTVLDIGGHIGIFAVVAARIVGLEGKVYTFEPTPFTRDVLKDVVELNDVAAVVEVCAEAVSARRGETVLFDTGNQISNANSLVRTERSKVAIPVAMISVDEFVKARGLKVDCLKIDVEGAELDVLIGARDTFLNHRPVARLGLHPAVITQNGQSLVDIWQLVAEYKLNVSSAGKPAEKDWFCSQPDLFDVTLLPF